MKEHATLATENFRLALTTFEGEAPSREWRITFLFYASLHAVNHALFPGTHAPERNFHHDDRESDMVGHKQLRTVARDYGQLKRLATEARYLPLKHPMPEGQLEQAKRLAGRIFERAGLDVPTPPAVPVPGAAPPAPV